MKLYYHADYVAARHGFDTTRKSGWIADSLAADPIEGVEVTAPTPLAMRDLTRVHDPKYVSAVRTGTPDWLAESQGFDWDPSLWRMVLSSNSGVLAAARSALNEGVAGSLSSGLHHARHDEGAGFCTFNGLVIAAKKLLYEGKVSSVLILDFDAHCGGGTAQLIIGDERIAQVDVSVSPFDRYPGHGNSTLSLVDNADDYLKAIKDALAQAHAAAFDLCLYNAGMDPHEGCVPGGLDGITADVLAHRERMVFDWRRESALPTAFVLAGGYISSKLDEGDLVELHRLTIDVAAKTSTPTNDTDDGPN
ncbi:hypothetical protein [Gordonia hankookensis]|uniref:Histone deacetylase domain-containing protein n=1 Tax=Gordonia hankookensis TaxID=589403 RepID=A0ABR7WD61_9ACTN|nr:hypothetical protein [Gordonia hankookensis]MBD1320580.1 hypothetical protein [Gordonia hankookensis]